jgi:hypothetical protein
MDETAYRYESDRKFAEKSAAGSRRKVSLPLQNWAGD